MIFRGSQKEGTIYKGGTKIGKVYKGDTLVYKSQKNLVLYAFGNASLYLIGSYDVNGIIALLPGFETITDINGTLGQSGSIVYCQSGDMQSVVTYYAQTIVVANVRIYSYENSGQGLAWKYIYVLENSHVGSPCISRMNQATERPDVITSSNITYKSSGMGNSSANRTSQYDRVWTINGIY